MKGLIILIILVALVIASDAFSSSVKANHKQKVKITKLQTHHDFEDKLVNGQYQYPDEANAKVDDEKMLDDLIGVRKSFRDRMKEEGAR